MFLESSDRCDHQSVVVVSPFFTSKNGKMGKMGLDVLQRSDDVKDFSSQTKDIRR